MLKTSSSNISWETLRIFFTDCCGIPCGGTRRFLIGVAWAQFAALSRTPVPPFLTAIRSSLARVRVPSSKNSRMDSTSSSVLLEPATLLRRESDNREVIVRRRGDPREEAEWQSWPSFEDDRCMRRGGTGRVPSRARDVTEETIARKGKTSRQMIFDITWREGGNSPLTPSTSAPSYRDHTDNDDDNDERNRKTNSNPIHCGSHAFRFSQPRCATSNLTLAESNSYPKRPTLYAHISTPQSKMKKTRKVITDVHRSRSASTGSL